MLLLGVMKSLSLNYKIGIKKKKIENDSHKGFSQDPAESEVP